jgi:UDP-N-acetylmuramoyl-L-alanyl-D-glutamate--2,6-diaminopimelate ligase
LNLSPEHLDFHKTQEKYFAAKASLFENHYSSLGIINRDDVHGRLLLDATEIKTVNFGLDDIERIEVTASSHSYVWRKKTVQVPVGGKFNVSNSLAAATVAASLGVDIVDIVAGLAAAGTVAGRFQSISDSAPFDVIVDYAHTPDALHNVLRTINELRTGNEQVIALVGCGGDRDAAKRPEMARIACDLSDRVILTSDNPRSEDPDEIIRQMKAGVDALNYKKVLSITDRREAIHTACALSKPGDIILVAGKGHETYQEINGVKYPFDDKQIISELFNELG